VSGTYSVTATHTYAEQGNNYSGFQVVILDDGGQTLTSSTGTATVADAGLTAALTAVALSVAEGNAVYGTLFQFTDANPGATAADFNNSNTVITWSTGVTSSPSSDSSCYVIWDANAQCFDLVPQRVGPERARIGRAISAHR
jgi:hypothetical protein